MKHSAPTGLFDIVPKPANEPWRSSHLWQSLEEIIRKLANQFGFQEIRTPIFERAELFLRSVGEGSDIVSKEMYLFEDKGGRQMALRPEGTAAAMRAFIENGLESEGPYHKLYYIAPMFRYDRPQAGRYRQHHQFGVEAIGVKSPEQDVEVIDLLYMLLHKLGLRNLEVQINTIGDSGCRATYREALREYLKPHLAKLSEESRRRFEENPLRILDSKDPEDKKFVQEAPSILDYLSEASYFHFERVKALLKRMGVPFTVNPQLVRGLDYYNETVFEVVTTDLGAQNSLGGGGRYDGLIKSLGGPDLPAVGFGAGLERILQAMINQNCPLPERARPTLYLIPMGDEAVSRCMQTAHHLRESGISAVVDLTGKKVGKAMGAASAAGARYVVVIGDMELAKQAVELKEMDTGVVSSVAIESLPSLLKLVEKSQPFMKMWAEMDRPFEDESESQFFLDQLKHSVEETKQATSNFEQRLNEMRKYLDDDKS